MAGKITELAALTGAAAATTDLVETVDVSDTSMAASGTNKKMTLAELVVFVAANGGGTPTGTKMSALTALTGASAAGGDILEVVDVSDTTMAGSGTNKKISLTELIAFLNANGIGALADGAVTTAKLLDDNVTNGKLANMATLTLKGNSTGSTADPSDLSVYAVQGMLRRPIVANTGTTLAPVLGTHENVMVTMSNASAQTITLPSDSTSNFPIGAEIDFLWLGVGQPAFAAGGSAFINSESSWLKMRTRYTAVTAKKIAANTWVLLGALAP